MNKIFTFIVTALICLGTNAWALEQDANGVYQIGTAEDLVAFSELVNGGEYASNAVLTADIDLSDISYFPPIGKLYWPQGPMLSYKGIFDGQGHVIYNLSVDKDDAGAETGLFGRLDGATVQNLGIMNATLKNSSALRAGVLCGCAVGSTITNCFTAGDIVLENCICSFNRKNGDGLFGLITSGCTVSNCYTTYATMHDDKDSQGSTIKNCYWGEDVTNMAPTGELCYKLNGDQKDIVWYQTIGEDAYPTFDSTHQQVYAKGNLKCDGTVLSDDVSYTNDKDAASQFPPHNYVDDVCVVCGQFNINFLEQKDGFYQIADATQLVRFMKAVNSGNNRFNAQLTADIDMSAESANYLPIGTEQYMYTGIFDGQGHRIKNMNISLSQPRAGVFGVIQSPAVIKDFILDESCRIETTGNYAGIIGSSMGASGPVYMENLGMEGTIYLLGFNGGGIIGNNNSSGCVFNMKNCYVTGNVLPEGGYSGALTGWAGNNAVFESCWSIGQIAGTDGPTNCFIRGLESGIIKNCYSKEGTQVPNITNEQVASGALCYLLNIDQKDFSWYQTIGEDAIPVLDSSHLPVYATAVRCDGMPLDGCAFTNDASQASAIPAHQFENGECIVCGQKQTNFMEPDADGYYNISDASQLVWFASAVNNGNTSINARLTADIDMSDYNDKFQPIGSESYIYSGTFDGQGHRIMNLNISLTQDCVGMFGVIQSPAVIKNFIFDESSSIDCTGYYCGLVGRARKGGGSITIEQVGMEGNVHLTGWNGAFFVGQSYGDALIIRNCYATGKLTADAGYSAAISAWADTNEGTLIENCWIIGEIFGIENEGLYFVRGMFGGNVRNSYCKYGTQVTSFTDEQVASGELCYLLNGKSFYEPSWFQTLDEDEHPVWDSTHGTVYKAGEEYGDVHDDASFADFKYLFLYAERNYLDEVIAEQALIDQYTEGLDALENFQTMESFAETYNEYKLLRAAIESSAEVYAAYQAKVDEVTTYLEENDDFMGEKRDQLEYYLTENEEPSELYPNGTALYILEIHTMTGDEIAAEIAKIDQLLEEAKAEGYGLHSDITVLLTNADFSNEYNGWSGTPGTVTYSPICECKNKTCDFYQTLTDLKNGVYELQVNGFFRPGSPYSEAGNLTSTNYAAMLYANGIQNYMMAAIEDMISVEDAIDGVNCFITEGEAWTDYAIYDVDDNLMGYIPGGQKGLKYAANAGRYLNHVLVNVTDGQLTIGFKLLGTGVANDCMDLGNIKLFYHGSLEEASAELDATLQCMAARAQTLYGYEASYSDDYAQYPNYSIEFRTALKTAIDAVAGTTDVADKYALIETFSELFQQIYDNKKVYINVMNAAENLLGMASTIGQMLNEEESQEVYSLVEELVIAYVNGTATEEMADYEAITTRLSFMPTKINGAYQIGDGRTLTFFSALVNGGETNANAVLTADIDMTDFSDKFQPIGSETAIYTGIFDGQGYRIKNLNISVAHDCGGFFGVIQSPAVIKNFIFDKSSSIDCIGYFSGLIGRARKGGGSITIEQVGVEGNIHLTGWNGAFFVGQSYGDALIIRNCYATGKLTAEAGYSAAISAWADTNEGTLIENCWVIGEISGIENEGVNFVRGMGAGTIRNCYSKYGTQVTSITDEQVAGGELCYLLNGDQSDIVWYQTLGEDQHPVFNPSHQIVIFEDGRYGNADGIRDIEGSSQNIDNSVYDLSGRRIVNGKLSRGIYIINRKKVWVNK